MATRSEILLPGWMEFRFRLEARAKLKVEESAVSESVDLVKADFVKQPLSAQDSAAELVR